ncbi:hypothetical protein HanIR_Chr17g0878361 [Helianthus annuus]|nr:hypothetical protein HanIR_Chr17g0878361 [Helianthus annuus]
MHDREDTHHDAGGHYEISEIQDDDVGFNIETDGNEDIQVTSDAVADAAADAVEVPDVNVNPSRKRIQVEEQTVICNNEDNRIEDHTEMHDIDDTHDDAGIIISILKRLVMKIFK